MSKPRPKGKMYPFEADSLPRQQHQLANSALPMKQLEEEKHHSNSSEEEEKQREGVKQDPQEEALPLLDDLLNKFDVDGLFEVNHKDLLKPFLTDESRKSLDSILANNAGFTQYILTKVVMLILQERFASLKGEWEMIVRKTKRAINPIRSTVSAQLQADIESIKCKEGVLGE